jgi:hypothetical protein
MQPDKCGFCGKTEDMVAVLVKGPNGRICNECVQQCSEIIGETTAFVEKEKRLELARVDVPQDRTWTIEVTARTSSHDVRTAILADVHSWRRQAAVSLQEREESATQGRIGGSVSVSGIVQASAVETTGTVPGSRAVSLEELTDAAPGLRLFLPEALLGVVTPLAVVDEANQSAGVPLSVTLTLVQIGRSGLCWVTCADGELPRLPWDRWRSIGDAVVAEDRSGGSLICKVRVKREDTHVQIESHGVALEELLALAETLVPYHPTSSQV